MANLKKVLEQMNKSWKNAEPTRPEGGGKKKDGQYFAWLTDATVELSKSKETLQAVFLFEDLKGKEKTYKTHRLFQNMDNEVSLGWLKGILELLEFDIPEDLTKLPKVFEKFFHKDENKVSVEINLVTKDDFQNTYLNRVLEDGEYEDFTPSEPSKSSGKSKAKDEDEDNEEKEEKSSSKKGKKNLDKMDWDELVEFASDNEITIPKKILKGADEDDLRDHIKDELEG